MDEVTLPPSPNWYLSTILACASDGTVVWGARNSIVIANTTDGSKNLQYSIIEKAHSDRVTSIAFCSKKEDNDTYRIVSGGDDNVVKIWNITNLNMESKNSKLDNTHKVIGVDWSKYNSNLVCFISEDGILVTWNINYDVSQIITLGKLTATCLACCPHDGNIVSIGCKSGLIYIVDIRGSGNIIYKLRGHDLEIVSLSWCPVPINIFDNKNTKEFLLASGAKDRNIFLWKAGTDGRYQTQLTCPCTPLDISTHKCKVSASAGNYTAVCWLEPTTLITSSPWGELLLWDLSGTAKKKYTPKLIHAKHGRGLFSIAGVSESHLEHFSGNNTDNWREKTNIRAIWSLAQDRQVICTSYLNNESSIEYTIPTQGGFVYCMSACPVDTSQIAFGVGDAMIRLWNLSEPHKNKIDLQILWDKIKGKVRALAWHPEKENLLAFATNEGRVGVFDTNVKKPPILCRQYHRQTVYTIGWGPAPNVKDYALYTCGDGELVYYNPEKFDSNPILVTKKDCTEFCWKPDYSLVALGFADGSISFLNRDLSEYGTSILVLNKPVQRLVWHPESTSSDLNISNLQNYLAATVIGTSITVFDISTECDFEDNEKTDSTFYKIVAVLNAHSDKVVCLAWSPHISGYLVSGSYDYTAQVWKVETQEVIGTYTSHLGPIQCCMWSPFSQDLILTGSTDFTLRIWSVSKQKAITEPVAMKISTRGKRTKKKKTKDVSAVNNIPNGDAINLNVQHNDSQTLNEKEKISEEQNSEITEDVNKTAGKSGKKKKAKKTTLFPGYAEITNNNKLWCSTVRKIINIIESDDQLNESGVFDCNGTENGSMDCNEKLSEDVPLLFGSKKDLENSLNYEKKILDSRGQYNDIINIDLWSGNLKENLKDAAKQKRLNDYLISLSPTVSIEIWKEMCEAYAMQLILEENYCKAASYFLCINKISEAIDVFLNAKLFKEAYVLATSNLEPDDPIVKNVLQKWADSALKDGNYQSVVICSAKLGKYAHAAHYLELRKDINSLILAIDFARLAKENDLIIYTANKAFREALQTRNMTTAKLIIKKCPEIQYREIELEMFIELNHVLKDVNDETIYNWLKGLSNVSILETLKNKFTKNLEQYSLLLQTDVYLIVCSPIQLQVNVSHELALSVISNPEKELYHIVKALDMLSQYEKDTVDKYMILMKYIIILDNKNFLNSKSIFNKDEIEMTQSLRAFLCDAAIHWYHLNNLAEDKQPECIELVLAILENCVGDIFNQESVKFWTISNEISKLENQFITTITEDKTVDKSKLIEQLDHLRNVKKQLLNKKIATPNPLHSYNEVMDFISKIPDEEKRQKITKHVLDTWKNAIS